MDDFMTDLYGSGGAGAQNSNAAGQPSQGASSSNADAMGYDSSDYTYDPRRTYGGDPNRYANTRSSYGQQPTNYGNTQSSYGQQPTNYGNTQSGYGQQSQSYGNPQSGYGQQPTNYGNTQSSYGQQSQSYGNTQSGYGQQSTGYSNPQTSYNDPYRNSSSGYDDTQLAESTTPDFWNTESSLESKNTDFMTVVLGAVGAAIGAIPGFFLIMGLARFGIIASLCGAALAAGTFFGFYIATRNSRPSDKQKMVVCISVMVLAVFFAVRISWTYKLRDVLIISKSYTDSIIASDDKYSNVTAESIDQGYNILFGFSEPTYSNCSANFNKIITNLNLKGKFHLSLLENYAFCALGCLWLFSRFGKSRL